MIPKSSRFLPRKGVILCISLATAFISGFAALFAQDFKITSVQVTNNDIRLTWSAPGGSNYIVQTATRLTGGVPNTNFNDLNSGSPIYVSSSGPQSASYTHSNGLLNSTSRFYRVRSLAVHPLLQVQPTNVVMAVGMTNRYKVMAIYPDNSVQDVTTSATLTSLNAAVAQVVGPTTNGFILVQALINGTGSLRAVCQGDSNTVGLTVGQLTGLYSVPALSSISNYVGALNPSVQVFGVFASGQTNNITPASNLDGAVEGGGQGSNTRVDYTVAANVANSYALITGQSAADGDTLQFEAGGYTNNTMTVQWCNYLSVSLAPHMASISLGATQQFSVLGNRADGSTVTPYSFEVNSFTSSNTNIAKADRNTFRVVGLALGTVTIAVNVNNLVNCGALSDSTLITITTNSPPGAPAITNQPTDEIVSVGDNAFFSVLAGGSPPLAYQWQFSGTNVAGATSGSLVVSNAAFGQQGSYRVVITNAYGSVTSSVANLTVAQAGVPLWTNQYGNGSANAIAVDGNGNVVVTGYSNGTNGFDEFATIKCSNAGVPLWTNYFNGPGDMSDYAIAVAVDGSGNVFVTGYSPGNNFHNDYATIKYSNAGLPLWTNRYNGPGNGNDDAQAIAVDGSGNVFVTGYSTEANLYLDYATIKYSNAGLPLWTNRYDGPGNNDDSASAIAVDSSGNVFVTGYSYGLNADYDYATIKYSSAGFGLWTNRYNGPGNGNDGPQAMAVDGSGSVFVTGYSAGLSGDLDYATIKYSNAGVPLWTNRYNGPGNGDDYARAIAVDGSGNVLVTGYSTGVNGDFDFATIKYSNAGMPLWTNRYNGPVNGDDYAAAVAVDGGGNVFVTGSSYPFGVTIKYSPAGTILWLSRDYNGYPNAVAVDAGGNVVVTGSGYRTLKYAP